MFSNIRIGLKSAVGFRSAHPATARVTFLCTLLICFMGSLQAAQEEQPASEPTPATTVDPTQPANEDNTDGPPAAPDENTPNETVPGDHRPPAKVPPQTVEPLPSTGVIQEAGDLEAFFDGAMLGQLKSKNIAGGVVAVVVDGKTVFSKGYGFSDVAQRLPVQPEATLFRIGSITKLFTWTAVMQQVEEGKLDLDTDISTYVKDLQIPSNIADPITLKHLMAHTSGFDEVVIGLFSHTPTKPRTLVEILREQMPARVRRPGLLPSYSNFGTALAGHVVESVAEMTWEEYVQQRILTPLGMDQTLATQPPIENLPPEMSQGYKWSSGRFLAEPFEYVVQAPAGAISMSAGDAAKFMLAHLNDGQLGGATILKPETAQQMREPLYRPDERVSANCHGLMEITVNGQRILGHGGATFCFHSQLSLLPESRVGIFIAFNTETADSANDEVLRSFMDRYFPVKPTARPQSIGGFKERAKSLVGEYLSTRYSHNSPAKLGAIFGEMIVWANDDDTITVDACGQRRRYAEIEPLIFQELDGHRRLVFHAGVNRQVDSLFVADSAAFAATKSEWYDSMLLHGGVFLGCMLIFASAFFYWPIIAFSADGVHAFWIRDTGLRGALSTLVWLNSALCIGFVIALLIELQDPAQITFGITPQLKTLLFVPQIIGVMSVLSIFASLIAWLHGYWFFPERMHFTLVALASATFTALLYYWKLLIFGR